MISHNRVDTVVTRQAPWTARTDLGKMSTWLSKKPRQFHFNEELINFAMIQSLIWSMRCAREKALPRDLILLQDNALRRDPRQWHRISMHLNIRRVVATIAFMLHHDVHEVLWKVGHQVSLSQSVQDNHRRPWNRRDLVSQLNLYLIGVFASLKL